MSPAGAVLKLEGRLIGAVEVSEDVYANASADAEVEAEL